MNEKCANPHKSRLRPILELAQKVVKKMCNWILGPVGPRKIGVKNKYIMSAFLIKRLYIKNVCVHTHTKKKREKKTEINWG